MLFSTKLIPLMSKGLCWQHPAVDHEAKSEQQCECEPGPTPASRTEQRRYIEIVGCECQSMIVARWQWQSDRGGSTW